MKFLKTLYRLFNIFFSYKFRKSNLTVFPLRLWVESTSFCNLKCVMCPNKDMEVSQKKMMSLKLFSKIVDEAKYFVNDIYLHHRGEPFLNSEIFEMIAYAEKALISTRFHSNACLMDKDKIDKLLQNPPSLISFSIDGFVKEIYEKIRVGGNFDSVIENILYLAAQKKEKNLSKPYIVIEKINFKNIDESFYHNKIKGLNERFLKAGVDEIIEKEEYTWADSTNCDNTYKLNSYMCTFPWYAMVICADGTVTPCPQDFFAELKMGNINESSISEIWNSDKYLNLRLSFGQEQSLMTICKNCDRLTRKTFGGVPLQYMFTFLVDQLAGYGKIRKIIGTNERN